MATSTKSSMKEMLADVDTVTKKKVATAPTTQAKTVSKVEERFADIENNTFYKIFFEKKLDPEEQKRLVVQAQSYKLDEGKEKNKESLKEFLLFKEYLQNDLEELSKELIRLNDTDVFSTMQGTINDINSGILDIEKAQGPLIEILEAMFELRKRGGDTFLDVFKEAKDDIAAEEERKKKVADNEARLQQIESEVSAKRVDIEMLGKRRFMGLLGPSSESQRAAIEKRMEVERLVGKTNADGTVVDGEQQSLIKELQDLNDPSKARQSAYPELAAQKAKLRELLDLTSEQHKDRSKQLVTKVGGFVDVTRERVTTVLDQMNGQSGQIDNMTTATNGVRRIYAVMTEASKEVSDHNQTIRTDLETAPENESPIAQMTRESKLASVNEYVAELGSTTVDTVKTFGNLQKQSVRLVSMKDANRQQIAQTREIASSGISETAQSLATVLQGIAAAGLNESSEAAKMSIDTMRKRNDVIIGKEAIKTAMGLETMANDIDSGIAQLEDYQALQRAVTEKNRENLKRVQESLGVFRQKATELQDDVKTALNTKGEIDITDTTVTAPAAANSNEAEAAPVEVKKAAPAAKAAEQGARFNKYD